MNPLDYRIDVEGSALSMGQRLSMRALHHLVHEGFVTREVLTRHGVTDSTVYGLLRERIDVTERVRWAIHFHYSFDPFPETEENSEYVRLYEFLRKENNPLLPYVREMLLDLIPALRGAQ